MSRADYAHWNEDQDYMWWQEEGKHIESEPSGESDWEYEMGFRDRDEELDNLPDEPER